MSFRRSLLARRFAFLLLLGPLLVEPARAWMPRQSCRPSVTARGVSLNAPSSTTIDNNNNHQNDVSQRKTARTAKKGIDWDWRQLAQDVFDTEKDPSNAKPILLFDGVCNFCNGGVNLCLDWDTRAEFRFASLQSKVGQSLLMQSGKRPDDLSSLVLVKGPNEAYFESDAVLRIAEKLSGLPWPVRMGSTSARRVLPKFVRDAAYKLVAANRYRFGETDGPTCRVDWDGTFAKRFVDDPIDDQ